MTMEVLDILATYEKCSTVFGSNCVAWVLLGFDIRDNSAEDRFSELPKKRFDNNFLSIFGFIRNLFMST